MKHWIKLLTLFLMVFVTGTASAQNVAAIGTDEYATLQEAVNAAGSGETITMIADATVADGVNVAAGKNIVLDLNGKVLSLSKHISNSGTLTIQDGSGTGKLESDAGYTIVNTGGTLTIASGTYTNNATDLILQRGGSITINGGSFSSSKSTVLNMQAYDNSSLTITNGTFTAEKNDAIYIAAPSPTVSISGGNFITHSYVPNGNPAAATAFHVVSNCTGGNITISGGTFKALSTVNGSRALNVGNNPGISVTGGDFYSSAGDGRSVSSGTNGILAGGTFDGMINSNYVANGKFAYPNNDYTRYSIEDFDETRVNGLAVAKIGDTYYTSLAEASAEITEGCTVTLLKDLDFSEKFTFYLLNNMTFDGNGHTLTGNIMIDCNNGSGVSRTGITVKDTKFVNTTATDGYVIRSSKLSGDFTVTGCTFDNTKGQAIQCTTAAGADVTITGNTFKNGTGSSRYINLYGTGTNDASSIDVTITGNIFYDDSNTENLRLNKFGANNEFDINGNYFEDPTHSKIENFNESKDSFEFTVYGLNANGEIDTTSEQTYIATGATSQAVISLATMVAQIVGGAKYTSLQAAVDAAHEMTGNVTVELLDDITGYSIVHQKAGLDLTIDGAAKTLAGQIIIDGDGRSEGTDKLTIQNIKFEDNKSHFYTGTDAFVLVPSTKTTGTPFYNNKNNYAHNVTVTNCSFTSTTSSFDVVGIKVTSGAAIYNVVISDNTASKLHSLAQLNGATGGTITNNTVSGGESFVNVTGGAGEMGVSGNTFTSADGADGYGIRENGSSTTVITLTDNTFTATSAVVLGKGDSQTAGTINVESGIYTGTISKTEAATGKIVVSGGYFSEEVAQDYIVEGKACVPATDMEGYFTIGDPHYVAQIGETKYMSLQAAVDAAYAMTGNVTIELIDNIEGYSIVKQKAGLNVTIDGKEKTVAGQIIIDGDGGSTRTETLDIKNIKFEDNKTNFVSGSDAFILVPSTNTAGTPYYNKPTNNYAHNVTISDCSFTSTSSGLDVVGVKSNSKAAIYNVVINNNTGTNLHSLAQLTAPTNGTIINNTVSGSESFVNVSGGGGEFTISGNTFTSDENASEGYGVRENGASTAVITLTDNNFTAANAVKLGKGGSATNGTINVVSGTYVGDIVKDIAATATGKIVISGGKFSAPLADQQYAEFIAEGMAGVNGLYPEEELAKNGVGTAVASVTDSEGKVLNYASLEAAMAAALDGSTVTLLADCSGGGIVVPQGTYTTGLTVDFGGFTYTVVGPGLAGSTGTQNQCFQLLKDNNITFQNGAIVADNSNLKMIIQNYANLTLDNMTLDATQGTNSIEYVLSTNNGSTTINDTNITAKDGSVAFDACCGWGGYNSNNVELTGSSVVTGPIEVSFYGEGTAPTLTLTSGTHNGEIVMGKNADQATITKTDTFVQNAPEGYKWVSNGEGTGTSTLTPKVYVAQIGEGDSAVKYETLAEAVEAASDGDTITMIADDPSLSNGSEVEINKSLTITGPTAENGEPLYTISGNSDVTGSNDIFITGSGNVTISNLKIKNFGNNAATDPGHAPLYVSTHFTGNLKLSNVYISDFNRGGLFLYGGNFEVDNCYIDCANATSGAFTKGIEIKGNATGTIKNTLICNMERSSTAYSNAGIEIYGNGSVTVEECTILSDKDGHAAVKGTYGIVSSRVGEHNPSGGTLEVKGCQIDTSNGSISISDSDTYGPVNNYSITVDDCDFTNYISTWSATSSITINSGTFSEDVYADAGTISIKGGAFTNFAPTTGDNGTIAISGGIFDEEVAEEYCAEGFIPTANTDPETMEAYPYTVKSGQFVAQIGDVKYETLAEAVAAVQDATATTIVMIGDETLTNNVVIGGTYGDSPRVTTAVNAQNITLDLNGHSITGDKTIYLAGGSLNITGEGTIETTGSGVSPVGVRYVKTANYSDLDYTSKRTLTIGENVTLKGADYGLNIFGTNEGTIANNIEVYVNGTVEGTLFVLGNLTNAENDIVVNVNGTVTSTTDIGIALNGNAKVNVAEGAKVTGQTGIEARAGVLNVNGGTITATATAFSSSSNGDGSSVKGAAISVAQHTTNLSTVVNILGGELTGVKNIAVVDPEGNNLEGVTVTVKDGLIGETTLIPEGYAWSSNGNGTSTLKKAVAKIGDTLYASLADAVAAVPTDGNATTIVMIDNETIVGNNGATILATQNVILDLNGKTVTLNVAQAKASQLITNKGTLTITDSSEEQSGKLTNAADEGLDVGSWPSNNYVTCVINNNGTLNIEAGSIVSTANGSICYAVDNNNTIGNAILNVNGGYLTSVGTVIRQFCNSTTYENTLNISGGKVITQGYTAIWTQLPGSDASSKKKATLNITGGEISGREYAWYDYSFGDSFEAVNYSISGGKFSGDLFSYAVDDSIIPGFITGGIFDSITHESEGETYDSDWLYMLAEDYVVGENTDEATKDAYPYMVRPGVFVAQIGNKKYESVADAIDDVPTDGTETIIIMLDDDTEEGDVIQYNKNIILDLNGHTLTMDFYQFDSNFVVKNGTLAGSVWVYGYNDERTTHFTLDKTATITADYGIVLEQLGGGTANGITVDINGTVNGMVWVMGNITAGDSKINVHEGASIVGESVGIALNGFVTLNVNGGSITGKTESGIEVRAGHLVVNDGTITSLYEGEFAYAANGNGTTTAGPAITVAQHTTLLNTTVEVLGGTLVTQNGNPLVAVFDAQENDLEGVTVTVKDEFITNSYIPEDYKWVAAETEGMSTLAPKVYVALNVETNKKYESLAEAVAAAEAGQTIQMTDNSTETAITKVDKDVTIDLNGKSVTRSSGNCTINVTGGALTITDNSEAGNGSIDNTNANNGRAIQVLSGSVTLEKGTIGSDNTDIGILAAGGTVTINGGNIAIGSDKYNFAIYGAGNAADIVINGGVIGSSDAHFAIYGEFKSVEVAGGTIEANDNVAAVWGGSMTVSGGELTYYGTGNVQAIQLGEGVAFSMTGGTLTSSANGFYVGDNGTTLTMTGGTINTQGISIATNGSYEESITISISGGKITSSGTVIYNPNRGTTVNISGDAELTGAMGVAVKGGTLNITGGTITANGTVEAPYFNGSGYSDTGDAVYVEDVYSSANSDYHPTVNISGGTLTSANGYAAQYWTNQTDATLANGTINITDGVLIGGAGALNATIGELDIHPINVSGGWFSNVVAEEYCADEVKPDTEAHTDAPNASAQYTVKDRYVAKIGNTKYESLADAIAAVKNGEVIDILTDITMTEDIACTLTGDKSFSINLGDKTIDADGHKVTLNNGMVVNTDKQADIFDAADTSKYVVVEEANNDGSYTYTCMTIEDYTGEYVLLDLWDGKVHNYPYTEAKQAKSITYKRRIPAVAAGNYQCWYVPFDYTIKDEDLENMDFFKIHMIAPASTAGEVSDNSEIWLYIEQLNAGKTMKGNRPYVVRTKGTGSDQSFVFTAENVPLLAPDASVRLDMSTSHFNYDFYGTYKQAKPNKTPSISLWSTGLMNWVSNNQVLPYRWYFHVINKLGQDDYANMTFFIVEEGNEPTGVDDLNITEENEIEGIYTIDGKKLDHPIKGLNIIKMKDNTVKKVYIK